MSPIRLYHEVISVFATSGASSRRSIVKHGNVPFDTPRPKINIRLRTRASRSRARTEEILEVEAPGTEGGQQNQLRAIVEEKFPGAEFRVFNDGAVSYTLDDLHIVAAYRGDDKIGFAKRPTAKPDQDDDGYEQLPLTA